MDEFDIEKHPDLMNPEWQKHAEREAWIGARQDRRRGRSRKAATIAAVVVVAAAAVGVYLWTRPAGDQSAASPVPAGSLAAVPSTATPSTAAPGPTDLPTAASVDLSRPFDNTPAQNWREGIDGLAIPPAAKTGPFSAKQVEQAQQQVKQAIVLAHFDNGIHESHNADALVQLFAPNARTDIQAHAVSYAVFFPEGYHLLPAPPRMNGKMTVRPGDEGELVVHVSYVVAYAFDPGTHTYHGPADLDPFVRVDQDYVLRIGSGWEPGDRGLWFDKGGSYFTSIACRQPDDGILAPAFSDPTYDAPPISAQPGEFDPDKPLPTKGNCGK
ncbi:hypothetical protein [Amycolatopsis benzoatilytica]|uniref:hypothetical protein n=1 Tax=Amycolatopsis benzoatilytica TaxID=346045 RepID=UPI00036B4DE4|nr:hypothetical protein [Amycolatopsis benzoatilytica]